jgi:hypothetical protein
MRIEECTRGTVVRLEDGDTGFVCGSCCDASKGPADLVQLFLVETANGQVRVEHGTEVERVADKRELIRSFTREYVAEILADWCLSSSTLFGLIMAAAKSGDDFGATQYIAELIQANLDELMSLELGHINDRLFLRIFRLAVEHVDVSHVAELVLHDARIIQRKGHDTQAL